MTRTEYSSKKQVNPSSPVKQVGPVMSSVSSLNHLTLKGAVPLKETLKRTVALGTAAWLSGWITMLGGSEENKKGQVKEVLTFGGIVWPSLKTQSNL